MYWGADISTRIDLEVREMEINVNDILKSDDYTEAEKVATAIAGLGLQTILFFQTALMPWSVKLTEHGNAQRLEEVREVFLTALSGDKVDRNVLARAIREFAEEMVVSLIDEVVDSGTLAPEDVLQALDPTVGKRAFEIIRDKFLEKAEEVALLVSDENGGTTYKIGRFRLHVLPVNETVSAGIALWEKRYLGARADFGFQTGVPDGSGPSA